LLWGSTRTAWRRAEPLDELRGVVGIRDVGDHHRGRAAEAGDLGADPFQVFAGLGGIRQDVDRVAERDGPEALEPAPDPHAQVGRPGGQLMDQDEPPAADGSSCGHG
jgi:hypothetical protein